MKYRPEIDGLRSIAVTAVILYHAGFLPQGYLGVDIFFVISGYLITSLIDNSLNTGSFRFGHFYERRIRRILPMTLFICLLALASGYFLMLPDDFENLTQSVIATVLFSNNLLLYFTSGYWDIVNHYKPLLHTWSLGVEEQFYLIFPVILFLGHRLFKKISQKQLLMIVLMILSLISCYLIGNPKFNFFIVTSRLYQFGAGALLVFAVKKYESRNALPSVVLLLGLIALLVFPFTKILLINIAVTAVTALLIYTYRPKAAGYILENPVLVFLGRISFSMYMWHQFIFAFFRQTVSQQISLRWLLLLFALIVVLSVITYFLIEQPYRNNKKISSSVLLISTGSVAAMLVCISFYYYQRSGVVRDVPELDIYKVRHYERGMHAKYNDRIRMLDKPFSKDNKRKILIIGNSFARDVANMLLENHYADDAEISYIHYSNDVRITERLQKADLVIFGSPVAPAELSRICSEYSIPDEHLLVIGSKGFGEHNGLVFNSASYPERCKTAVDPDPLIAKTNAIYGAVKKSCYVDLMALLMRPDGRIPLFTPACKLISQDGRHLTKAGAVYLGSLLARDTNFRLRFP
ncbi:acyltransferase family protein [Sediminibacterium ginsengisoli]|uniref:Peptidoglycan/LPS O-acetylase OafA/YrhL, contains acyltransferase and SGNH-hydrolase domains n=1 Tax=Sediminibacterium ginsengisoli TaxID=413434 RepID=A0A1T4RKM0_9BACT|nr:acyltransferase [Sediminibacterium ginsengisoli]SKA16525.1 Peptidoglycan/LPS O-acetylase OafA/YrhL, contains acyltransferase and SGNH-hydrolase domains [Sediminibacterium ginsengisoli]